MSVISSPARAVRPAAVAVFVALIVGCLLGAAPAGAAEPPRAAQQYQRDLTREARAVFGLQAPVPVMAAQIHQESSWRPDARSPYAQGIAQFVPATAEWVAQRYPQLGDANVWDPRWSIRAMVQYNRFLHDRYAVPAATECDRWAFLLSAYNGGQGWLQRDRAQCRETQWRCVPCEADRWFSHVALTPDPRRADWAVQENRGYPQRILLTLQPRYRAWGRMVECPS